jgi:hypothetical protein
MFEDIHKIDSAVFKPDPTKAKSDRDGKSQKKRGVREQNLKSIPGTETGEIQTTVTGKEKKEHPFLDIRV